MFNNRFGLYLAIVLSMIIWSFSFIWTRMAILSFQPVTLVVLRLVLASLFLLIYSFVSRSTQRIATKDIGLFMILALFEPFIYYLCETYGLTYVNSTLASVIIATIPLFSPVLAYVALKDKISVANVSGVLVSFAGVYLVVDQQSDANSTLWYGVVLLLIAVFASIAYAVTLRRIPAAYQSHTIIFYQSLFGLVYFVPVWFYSDSQTSFIHQPTLRSVGALLMLSFFASVVAFVLFAGAVRRVGVARTNVFVNLIPVFTAFFSWMVLGEQLTLLRWVGVCVVVVGLFVSQMRIKRIQSFFKNDAG